MNNNSVYVNGNSNKNTCTHRIVIEWVYNNGNEIVTEKLSKMLSNIVSNSALSISHIK